MTRALWVLATLLCAATASAQNYRYPMELPASGTQPYVTAYRDHDTGGGLQDWNCGTKTYNGHKGNDFGIGSFPVMDAGSRWIVAAADGKVVFVNDGCFDRCTTGDCACGSGFGNYVKVEHADKRSTYYAHMMKGSLQVKLGDTVTCGQKLGKVGSSGNSTGPHLHFEPRTSGNVSFEPFKGSCGSSSTSWLNQGAYLKLPSDQCPAPPVPDVDGAKLVSDTPSGTIVLSPGEAFQKTFVVENTGNTTWTKAGGYFLAHDAGDAFGAAAKTDLDAGDSVGPGKSKTWTLSLTAPASAGTYSGAFKMEHSGTRFGPALAVDVQVTEPEPPPVGGSGGQGATGGAGVGGSAGGWPSTGGSVSTGGVSATTGGTSGGQKTSVIGGESESGCGCRVGGTSNSSRSALLLVALGLFALGRRRLTYTRSDSR